MNRNPQAQQRGLTLVELMITLTITATAIGAAVPSFKQARERRHLDGVAAQMVTDLRHARSLSVAHGANVRFSLHRSAAGSCYVVHSGPAANCSCAPDGSSSCRNGAKAFQAVGFPAGGPVQLASNSASMLFDADRGTVTPTGTLRVQSASGASVHQVISLMGRVRSCSPGGVVSGYPRC
jgi:type IV fimbrial biogenesis protein FimT